MNTLKYLIPLDISVILLGCGGSATVDLVTAPKTKPPVDNWTSADHEDCADDEDPVTGATFSKLKEAITTGSGYETTPILETEDPTVTSFDHIVQSCNAVGGTDSAEVFTSPRVADMVASIGYLKASNTGAAYVFTRNGASWDQQVYIKASNADISHSFGQSISLSDDENTLAVSAHAHKSQAIGINGTEVNTGAASSGAVYVY